MVRKGQTYSMDIIIGVVIFMLLITVFLSLLLLNSDRDDDLRRQVEVLFLSLDEAGTTESSVRIFNGNQVNMSQIENLFQRDYGEVKQELGIRDDFCIVFVDSSGGLIGVNVGGEIKHSFGHDSIFVSENIRCGD